MPRVPDSLPFLQRGRHWRPAAGACLMELTSILAGERFSDAPRCTDPVLAAVARAVNDYSSDPARQRLAVLASELTTANGGDAAAGSAVARHCLLTALPFAEGDRRRVLVAGLLGLERAVAGRARGWDPAALPPDTELALLPFPEEMDAAVAQLRRLGVSVREHRRRGLPRAVEVAVATLAERAPDADDRLHRLLVECLAAYRPGTVRTGRRPVAA